MQISNLATKLILVVVFTPLMLNAQISENRAINGVYEYENYEKIGNGCCKEKWTLTLKKYSSFYMQEFQDQGCYSYTKEAKGEYVLWNDTLSLLCSQQHEIEVIDKPVGDSIFQISFPLNIYDVEKAKYIIENQLFFSVDSKGRRKKVDWVETYPRHHEASDYSRRDRLPDTVSFLLKRTEIEDYLICGFKLRGLSQRSENENTEMTIVTIDMSETQGNNYLVHAEGLNAPYSGNKDFKDYSLYQFRLEGDTLTTTLKYWNSVSEHIHKQFVKQ